MTTLDDDTMGNAPFQHPVHLSLTMPTLTSSIVTLLFLSRFSRMAMDIGSLAAGVTKNVGKPLPFYFRCTFIPL
jgi:hypothetical protein